MKRLIPLLLLSASLVACDYVDEPVAPGSPTGPTGTVKRRVLLEEFTGHRCSTCPAAHEVAQQLSTLYGERVVLVGIHATSTFAAPLNPPAADGRYSTDYRTEAGNAYVASFGVSFLPTGLVSRRPFENSITISKGSWGSAIGDLVDQDAAVDLTFTSITHDAATNTVAATLRAIVLRPLPADQKVTIYLTEDNVVDWQLNATATPADVPNYVHRHVLRKAMNGTWGTNMIPVSTAVGDTITYTLAPTSVDPGWNVAKCALVGYVYNSTDQEVLQVVERKLLP